MNGCGSELQDAHPLLKVQLQGRGEDAMRMDKRLRCAGRALGIRIEVDWDAARYGKPAVRVGDRLVIDRLVATSELEGLLRPFAERLRNTHSGHL